MRYNVVVKKNFKYIKTYNVIRRVNDTTNAASKALQRLIMKYMSSNKKEEK